MKIIFPQNTPTVVTTKTERDQSRRTEQLLRHAALADAELGPVAERLRQFIDEQERQAEAELDELADAELPAAG